MNNNLRRQSSIDESKKVQELLINHYSKVQDINKDYFKNVLLGEHKKEVKFQSDYQKKIDSTYTKDFDIKPEMKSQTKQTKELYSDFDVKFPMDIRSSYKEAFTKQQYEKTELTHPDHKKHKSYIPFGNSSSYQNQFINWGYQKETPFPNDRNYPKINPNQQFIAQSSYKQDYNAKKALSSDDFINHAHVGRLYQNPIAPIVPFQANTSNKTYFKVTQDFPNKTKYVTRHYDNHINRDIRAQFISSMKNDFNKTNIDKTLSQQQQNLRQSYNSKIKQLLESQ